MLIPSYLFLVTLKVELFYFNTVVIIIYIDSFMFVSVSVKWHGINTSQNPLTEVYFKTLVGMIKIYLWRNDTEM